jgi:hypothetical protein
VENDLRTTLESLVPTLQPLPARRSAFRELAAPRTPARPTPIVSLHKSQLFGLGARRGQTVECLEGSLWLTFDYDRRDIVVEAGQTFIVDSDAPGWIQALSAARMRMTSAPEAMAR